MLIRLHEYGGKSGEKHSVKLDRNVDGKCYAETEFVTVIKAIMLLNGDYNVRREKGVQ